MKPILRGSIMVCFLFSTILLGQTATDKRQQWKNEVKEKLRLANQPLDFYGQVIDQLGQPVKGVKVAIEALYLIDSSGTFEGLEQAQDDHEESSDENGRFEFHKKMGTSLVVELKHQE